jgi:hypothetical protein
MSWGVATQNGVSVSLASIVSLSCGAAEEFNPASLFSGGAKGAWYDPSDFSTLFQDSANATPVTAVEQSVGLMLDKSQGLVLGSNVVTNGTFNSDTSWTKGTSWTISGGTANAGGTGSSLTQAVTFVANTLYKVTYTVTSIASGNIKAQFQGGTAVVGTVRSTVGTFTEYLSSGNNTTLAMVSGGTSPDAKIDNITVEALPGNHASQTTAASRPVLRARYNNFVGTATLATQNVTTLATTYNLSFSGAGTITLTGTNIGVYSAGTNTITCTAGTLTATVIGTVTNADLRFSSTATSMPAYQLVTTSTNYDTVGFLPYLVLDGSNDSFATVSIDFSATDKMAVIAGVTKLSDAAQSVVAELSATIASNNGSFLLTAPNSAAANFNFSSKGTTQVDNTVVTYASPYTAVLAASGDISAGTNSVKVNGGTATTASSSQGTGNYGNYPLYIGRRNNTSLPFNGRFYQMIVCGKALSAAELSSTEVYVNTKTGAY